MTITNTFSPNTVIASAKFNTNYQTDIRDKFNAMIHGSTGHTHDGGTGNGAPVVLQASAPTVTRQLGFAATRMQYYDGTAARLVMATAVANTMLTGGSIDGAAIANSVLIPSAAPTSARALGLNNDIFKYFDSVGEKQLVPIQRLSIGIYNIGFAQGADSSQIKITSGNGTTLGTTNPGWVVMRSSTAATFRVFAVTEDVTIDLTGAHWGMDGNGNVTGALLRIWAIDDNATLKWGVGYQGGFEYIRNTQDDTTAANINLPEEILVNTGVSTDNSPMLDCGHAKADFTDSTNEWAITSYVPGLKSADGLWQPYNPAFTGWSAAPTMSFAIMRQIGADVTAQLRYSGTGTSNSTSSSVTVAIKANRANMKGLLTKVLDNNVAPTSGGVAETSSASTAVTLGKDLQFNTSWTNSGVKAMDVWINYEAYRP